MAKRLVALFCLLAVGGCAAVLKPDVSTEPQALRAGAYALDPAHRALLFKIDHLGFSAYVGRFDAFDASLDFDEANPESARVEAVIEMASLDVGDEEFAETLKGPNWFDAATFPQAVFRSTSIDVTGDNRGVMIGDLTLHGVTAPVSLDVVFNGGGTDRLRRGAYVVGFSASGSFRRSDFGIDRFSGLIADDVAIEIEAEFLRR